MTLIQADAFNLPYPSGYFHACVTSPPYWGLRKYAGDQGEEPLGLEATPEHHIERMVEIFREVRRVLRDDGVLWLNYGDCYAASSKKESRTAEELASGSGLRRDGRPEDSRVRQLEGSKHNNASIRSQSTFDISVPQGSLMLMPHRLAIALQDDGWIVRNDLVWFKRNPMPESVAGWRWERKRKIVSDETRGKENYRVGAYDNPQRDHGCDGNFAQPEYEYGDDYVLRKSSWRHTRAHEYVFQLVKGMGYYCNQEAVREDNADPARTNYQSGHRTFGVNHDRNDNDLGERSASFTASGRNPRSVLDVPTAPYKGSHYATFPPKLIAPLIQASVPRKCCPACGAPWAPVVERKNMVIARSGRQEKSGNRTDPSGTMVEPAQSNVTDYRPTCEHDHEPVPGRVLDIFGGSGTTGMVAKELMVNWVVMDISRPYLDEQSKIRTKTGSPSNEMEGLPMFDEGIEVKSEEPPRLDL